MEAALVDIGNVLLNLRRHPVDVLFPESKDTAAHESFLQLCCCFETGAISEVEFISLSLEVTGFEGSKDELVVAWNDIFDPIPEMWDWCARMKKSGMKLILFSNTNSLHRARFLKEPVFSLFDSAVYSDEVGEMKPGCGMYECAVNVLKLNPSQTIYVDDLEQNIETGRRFGFQCSRFFTDDPAGSVARLDALCY